MKKRSLLFLAILSFGLLGNTSPTDPDPQIFWMKLKATNKFERSQIADVGVAIEAVTDDFVTATGNLEELNVLRALNFVDVSFPIPFNEKGFPPKDDDFHDEQELHAALVKLTETFPNLVRMNSIGKSVEGRDIWALRISGDLENATHLPGVIFMGGHHAREHLSVETPLRIWTLLLEEYAKGNERVKNLIDSRDIHVIPAVNPDGLSYDIASGYYRHWRKNRSINADGSYGVDLNRNYDFEWGKSGASPVPRSETYRGSAPFSEPETRAIRDYIEAHENITILLSFHTYSQLILYPWGHTYAGIAKEADRLVHEIMAKKMAEWNGYTPQQSSDLYTTSGDTTDWAYGKYGIISFTFELDPSRYGGGGFYPGAGMIPQTVQKNIEPTLYLVEQAGNPYGVIQTSERAPF